MFVRSLKPTSGRSIAEITTGVMARVMTWALAFGAMALAPVANAVAHNALNPGALTVTLVRDDGRAFEHLPFNGAVEHGATRQYVVAERQARYRIRIRNNGHRRVAVVIAVDGRNAISGDRSDLSANEAMYVLGPYQTQWVEGWRTNLSSVKRFYFTHQEDAYATWRGDKSAMGVVAVAAFYERQRPEFSNVVPGHPHPSKRRLPARTKDSVAESYRTPTLSADAHRYETPRPHQSLPQAGTGLGESQHAPARYTQFVASPSPVGRYFLKYEWRETLVAMGVIPSSGSNRFWPQTSVLRDPGFVAVPGP